MGRSRAAISSSESEIEIKVQPRSTPPQPPYSSSASSSGPHHRIRPSHRPPPPPKLFRPWVPWLVPFTVLVNIALFVYAMYLNNCPENYDRCVWADVLGRYAFQSTKENPLLGPSAATLLKLGALEVHRVVKEHQVWRLFSCMWLHAGVFHVLANMLSLLFVGIRLEQEFGFVRIGVVYVLSGVGGSLLSSLFVRNTISVGASGALFGLLGAMLSELLTNWSIYENKLAALTTLVFIIMINLAVGILPHVDNFAHLGGFITGFLVGFVVLIRPQYGWVNQRKAPPGINVGPPKSKFKAYQFLFLFIALAILIIGFIAGMTLLVEDVDGNDHCSWCHYLSCMPTPFWSCESRCTTMQLGSQVNLTCMANQKTGSYVFLDGNNTAELQRLCTDLCT